MAGSTVASKWKSEKTIQLAKREAPATLQPLDYTPTPTPKEDTGLVHLSKRSSQNGKHVKSRPHVLESLATSPQQYNFVPEIAIVDKA